MNISKTKEVMAMMMRQHVETSPIDLYLHGGDLSYADGAQVRVPELRVPLLPQRALSILHS